MMINGHNLYIERHGPECGPVVVLLHHGLGSVRAWKEQITELDRADYLVLAYDRWGYGASAARPALDLPTFATDVEDLRLLLEKQGIRKTALVGHSDGGTIALYFAARYPELVERVVTVAAHIYIEPKMESGILEVANTYATDERFRYALQHVHGDKYESVFHNWFDAWHKKELLTWDMRQVLSQIRCPVLVVQGENDEHATPQHATDISTAIAGSELWIVPETGHMLPQQCVDKFNEKLLQFLARPTGG